MHIQRKSADLRFAAEENYKSLVKRMGAEAVAWGAEENAHSLLGKRSERWRQNRCLCARGSSCSIGHRVDRMNPIKVV